MFPWILLILAVAVVLMVGIERLIARLGIRRVEDEQKPLALLAERLERWTAERRRRD